MKNILLKSVLSILMLSQLTVKAQNGYGNFDQEIRSGVSKRALKKARSSSEDAAYSEAIQRYRKLLNAEPDNVTYNKELGMTLFDSPYQKVMCIPYLEKAIAKGKIEEVGELYYPLAIAYRMKGNYEKGLECLGLYLNQLKSYGSYLGREEEMMLIDEINREIEICNNSKTYRSIPPLTFEKDSVTYVPVIKPMQGAINTIYDDYSPVFTNHDSTIVFTSRRKGEGGKVNWDGKYFEDIWLSERSGESWGEARSIGPQINTSGHEAVNSISRDGKKLYIYRAIKNGSILQSDLKSRNNWSEPTKLTGFVNSKAWETSLGVTLYDTVVYFVSDRKGGAGGRDIYVSRKNSKGEWEEGVNLGPVINTAFEEDAPFLSRDGKYLYFASTGHTTMGGFDLFRSELKNNTWSEPENLGAPINTENHDLYLLFSENGEKAWLSSQRITNDTLNDMNIYEVGFDCKSLLATTLKGILTQKNDAGKSAEGTIYFTEVKSNKLDSVRTDANGNYEVKVEPEKTYRMIVSAKNYLPDTAELFIPKQCKAYDLYQSVAVENIKEGNRFTKQITTIRNGLFDIRKSSGSKGGSNMLKEYDSYLASKEAESKEGFSTLTLEKALKEGEVISTTEITFVNINFDYDRATLRKESKATLDKVAAFMKANPDAKVELWGYADSVGTEEYNQRLSIQRSTAARNYLTAKGINKNNLITKGFGESDPLSNNETEEGRAKNRRVEFRVFPKSKNE